MCLKRKKGFLCASVSLWLMITAAMIGTAADNGKPADAEFKVLLEKYAAAYSAMDAKTLEPLVSKQLLEKSKEQFHQYRKAHQKPELTIIYSKQKDDAVLEASATLKVGGKDVYANQPTIYTLQGGRITGVQQQESAAQSPAVPSKRETESFWDAVRVADAIGIIAVESKTAETGKEKAGTSVTGSVKTLLSGEPVTGEEIKLPQWVTFQLKPGRHLLPLAKSGNNFEVFGMGYEVPVIPADSDKLFADIFNQYKQLPAEKENEFLKNLLLDTKLKALHYSALRNISMSGEFKRKLNSQELESWHKIYLAQGDDLTLKSALIRQLSNKNFDPASPFFLAVLEDKQLSGMVGGLFMRHDPAAFAAKMLQYLDEPAKREIALRNAFSLVSNPEYVAKAMKYFDPNDKQLFMAFIPVLTAKDNQAGKEIIAKFLKESDLKKDFISRIQLFMVIWRNNDSAYIAETKTFLAANEINEMLRKSPAYPVALSYLYKNNDLDGMKMLLKYLESIKPGSSEEMLLQNLSLSLRIKSEAPRQSSDTIAGTPFDILRHDLETKIKASEKNQQNSKDNIKK